MKTALSFPFVSRVCLFLTLSRTENQTRELENHWNSISVSHQVCATIVTTIAINAASIDEALMFSSDRFSNLRRADHPNGSFYLQTDLSTKIGVKNKSNYLQDKNLTACGSSCNDQVGFCGWPTASASFPGIVGGSRASKCGQRHKRDFEGSRKGTSTSHASSSWFYDAQASPLP